MSKFINYLVWLTAFCLFTQLGCKKSPSGIDVYEEIPDFTIKVSSSVNGFVTDNTDNPVTGALVKFGQLTSTTDRFGYFEIKNANVVENFGVVSVNMQGYFNAAKTFISKQGSSHFCRVKLINKTITGTIQASAGGTVSLNSGASVSFPADAIVVKSTNSPYTGSVNVSLAWLNPLDSNLTNKMPGDLRGLNTGNAVRSLTTFGMIAVELTDNSGQQLQLKDGKKATINVNLPNSIVAQAPTAIPLWYFDETKGLWIEEGTATKTGNKYSGEVGHFSWWNCDLPNASVELSFTIMDSISRPLGNTYVEISPLSLNSWGHVGGYTDETGRVLVPVTANTQYTLQIFPANCASSIPYTKIFSVETSSVDLGSIAIPTELASIITGTVTNCNNSPLSNGRIFIQVGTSFSIATPDNQGFFTIMRLSCSNISQLTFIAEDLSSSQQGPLITHTIHTGLNNIGNLQACGLNSSAFLTNTIDGITYEYQSPDSLTIIKYDTIFYVNVNNRINSPNRYVGFSFIGGSSMGVGSSQRLLDFISSSIPEQVFYNTGMLINITETGNVGEFIAGNFSGVLTGATTLHQYQVNCRFRIRRYP